MKRNERIVFRGREMYGKLIRNKKNRAVLREDFKNNDYLSPSSVKRGEKRVSEIVDSIRDNGWKNYPVFAYLNDDGYYVLLQGNTRRAALDRCVEEGILDDYPAWDVDDLSAKINPDTGKPYTLEEAEAFVEFNDIHAPKPHTATDVFERHAGDGAEICREICGIAKDFGMSTTLIADLVTGIRGSSRENYVSRVVEMDLDHERLSDVKKIAEMLDIMDAHRPDGVKKSFKDTHSAYAFENVYRLCKWYGVGDDFVELMKAIHNVRRPDPFLHFFDTKRENAYIDQILYIIDGTFETANSAVAPKLNSIVSALEKGGAMAAIAKFHRAFRMEKANIVLANFYKKAV